ncbi:FAD-dependent monooxygenase, partial [Mycobacteroides chelonae]
QGFSPVVIDSASEFEREGYLLALNEQIGQKVAEKMELLDQLREFEVPLTKNVMYDDSGGQLLRFEMDHRTLNTRVGLMLNRADLHATLYEAVNDTVEFRMGQEITSIQETTDAATVTFSSGETETYDLVIGADGMHSRVRELVFGKEFPKYMGHAYFAFITSNQELYERIAVSEAILIRGDGFTIAYHRLQGNEIGAYVFHRDDAVEKIAPDQRREHMLSKYGRFDPNFEAILEGMKEGEHVFYDGFTQIVMPAWHKGRICLIGD